MQDTSDDTLCPHTGPGNAQGGGDFLQLAGAASDSAVPGEDLHTSARVWSEISWRIAAADTMRLWRPHSGFATTKPLSRRLPIEPAAVPIYRRARTLMLVFDLDAKQRGSGAVLADYVRLTSWIGECGARYIADVSTSGGRHVIVPLSRAVTVDDVRPLLALVGSRCPTVDPTPMLNAKAGCITAPGSACREGGHRQLIGSVSEAVFAFADRAGPEFIDQLAALLGPAIASDRAEAVAAADPDPTRDIFEGVGEHRRLRATYRRHDPISEVVLEFATRGALARDKRWRSRSEARQAALYAAAARGYSFTEIAHETSAAGEWHRGLGGAYSHDRSGRPRRRPRERMYRDWIEACRWLESTIQKVRLCTHKNKHTGGGGEVPGCGEVHRTWLAHASAWCEITLRSAAGRHATAAVLQALAVMAARAGTVVHGVPTVAVGGRSLSLAAGLLSESTVWTTLRRLREMPGAPILLIRKGEGPRPDQYALVTPDVTDPYPDAPGRPRVTPVHPAWIVIGHQHRRVHELVSAGVHTPKDLATAARMSRTAVYDSVAELSRCGLLHRSSNHVAVGGTTLADIADAHRLDEEWADRVERHREARRTWIRWLNTRQNPLQEPPVPKLPSGAGHHHGGEPGERAEYLAAVLATGPPATRVR